MESKHLILVQILQQIFGTVFSFHASVEKRISSDQPTQDLISSRLADYLSPFENCTTMIFTGKTFA